MDIYARDETTQEELQQLFDFMFSALEKEFMSREQAMGFMNEAAAFIESHYLRIILVKMNKHTKKQVTIEDLQKMAPEFLTLLRNLNHDSPVGKTGGRGDTSLGKSPGRSPRRKVVPTRAP